MRFIEYLQICESRIPNIRSRSAHQIGCRSPSRIKTAIFYSGLPMVASKKLRKSAEQISLGSAGSEQKQD